MWAVGNHDLRNGNWHYIKNKTKRDFYYRHDFDNISVLVFNTLVEHPILKDSCDWKSTQVAFLQNELDHIQNDNSVKVVVLFSHNPIWSDCENDLLQYERIGNQNSAWVKLECDTKNTFRTTFYPQILSMAQAGKKVIFVAGDGGQYDKTFYYRSQDDIEFYVTGINNSVKQTSDTSVVNRYNTNPDSVLIFTAMNTFPFLIGEFVPLNKIK